MKQILVVDDLPEFRKALKFLLEKPETKVLEAGNGQDALKVIENGKIDVVITDCSMPIMSGIELMQVAKERYPRLPFIVVSSTFADAQTVHNLNPYAVIPKPPDFARLDSTVQTALGATHDIPPCSASEPTPPQRPITPGKRPEVRGKFLFVGNEKLYIKGVTYGPFRPDAEGSEYHMPQIAGRAFAQMAASGFNAVRVYTVPPRWLLDLAQHHGLRVMVGLPWEQHIAFLDDQARKRNIEAQMRSAVRTCAGHPALLAYTLGNEIPAGIVRWYGRRKIEAFLARLCNAVRHEDPGALVTYVNFPSTEYLNLPFIDFVSFNVYLEANDRLKAYLARLQNLAGDRPLLMAEIGLDSLRNGEKVQADVLARQIRTVFNAGCAGSFIFAWTDEWHRGGCDIEDWAFGLTDRWRRPKPALKTVRQAYRETPFSQDADWPRISVAVCSYNGSHTIRETLEGLQNLAYPHFEIIVVDDGSTDGLSDIVQDYDVQLIRTQNRGLSSARNTALKAATGDLIAYIDDDAYPDLHWLHYLAIAFADSNYAAIGGPNLPPLKDGWIADCVAHAPGGPTHVLLTDCEAEHIPGCNMAFRTRQLRDIGGFDPQFRAAGDDVDVCWRLQKAGWKLGFSPAAQVWHRRRNSVRAYWKQQVGYGRAEAMLERKWPEKYNRAGHIRWQGRLYGKSIIVSLGFRQRVYHGTWGSAPFQSLYEPAPGILRSLPAMPEWYLLVAALAGLSVLGHAWKPLLVTFPLFVGALTAPVGLAFTGAARMRSRPTDTPVMRVKRRVLTTILHLIQPLARLWGRLRFGLTPWRRCSAAWLAVPRPQTTHAWSETWQRPESRVEALEAKLREYGQVSRRGGDFDRWDLEIRGGLCGAVRLRTMVEEHGAGKQLIRFRTWPRPSRFALLATAVLGLLGGTALFDNAIYTAVLLGGGSLLFALNIALNCAAATAACLNAIENVHPQTP